MRASYVKGYDAGPAATSDPLLTPDVVALLGRFERQRRLVGQANAHRVDHLASLARAALARNAGSMAYFAERRGRIGNEAPGTWPREV